MITVYQPILLGARNEIVTRSLTVYYTKEEAMRHFSNDATRYVTKQVLVMKLKGNDHEQRNNY